MSYARSALFALLIAAPLAADVTPIAAQDVQSLAAPLPVNPLVKIGTLPNGLRYYIRKNAKPEQRAELRLAVNAGAILENQNQLGLAHFVEHMAFNGTRHFAKNDLVKYLQSIGVRFGADLNAYTAFDETVYMLTVPTDSAQIVDRAFLILEDWAHGQMFDTTEVVSERGVVHEEWRLGRGAGERMLQQWLPIALQGSLYAKRLPIGNEQSIMTATPRRLRSYYDTWYRPDNMAVIAVGDFDVATIEAEIQRHFAGIPRPKTPLKRPTPSVPATTAPLIAITGDAEATSTDVSVMFKQPRVEARTIGEYRRDLVGQLYLQMFNARLGEIAQKPDAPFVGAQASRGSFFARDVAPFTLDARVKDEVGAAEQGVEALLVQARRIDEFGFLQAELDRARANLLRGYELSLAERDKTPSGGLAAELVRNFLVGEPIPGIEYEHAIANRQLPTITLDEINKLAASWITPDNRVVIVETPRKQGVAVPSEAGILAAFDRAAKSPVVAYTENVSGDALLAAMPVAGRVVGTRSIGGVAGVTEWKLSNGARVLVKPTDFRADEVLFGAYSAGGTSLAPDSDFVSATLASQIVGLSGLAGYSRVELGKKLAGKAARVSPSIGQMSEGFNGTASPKDLETLLQLTYLNFTSPRLDTGAFAAFRSAASTELANRGASPDEVFRDTIQWTMAQHDFRSRPFTQAVLSEVNPQRAVGFFKDRFGNAGDFTFVFIGNVDTLALRPLVERYLASLPAIGRKDAPKNVGREPPKGVVERWVHKGVEAKANTVILFTGSCVYAPENRFALRALTETFQLRLIETLREKLGATYSPSVQGGCGAVPREEYTIQVRFASSPENVEPLKAAVFALIDTLKTAGPVALDITRVKEQILRGREVDVKSNGYWLHNIIARDQAGEDLGGLLQPYDDMVRALTADQVREAARRYFDTTNYARFVLLPEVSVNGAGATSQPKSP